MDPYKDKSANTLAEDSYFANQLVMLHTAWRLDTIQMIRVADLMSIILQHILVMKAR